MTTLKIDYKQGEIDGWSVVYDTLENILIAETPETKVVIPHGKQVILTLAKSIQFEEDRLWNELITIGEKS